MHGGQGHVIYLDNHATTCCDQRVVEAMVPYFTEFFGNPSSTIHKAGKDAAEAINKAREKVASLIGAAPKEIIFTSGATESNNLAVRGFADGGRHNRRVVVTTSIEHKSVLSPCEKLDQEGYEVRILAVDCKGKVSIESAKRAISDNTLLVSIQTANNEIGTIQDINDLAQIAHENGALFHTDAAQAVGKIPIDVDEIGVDLLSFSAHKMYGPKGIGALYIRGGPYSIPIQPVVVGGGQEYGLRPGTHNVPAIVGFGEACRLCVTHMREEAERVSQLRDALELGLMPLNVKVNGDTNKRLPGNSSLTFPGIDSEALVINTPELAISTGSACTTNEFEPSHVLLAIGLDRVEATSTIRIGLGRFSLEDEIPIVVSTITSAIDRIHKIQACSISDLKAAPPIT